MLYPLFAMVLLTTVVGLVAFVARYKSVTSGEVKIKYYRTMEGQPVSDHIKQTTRCFNNQFEVPVLFYVAGLAYIELSSDSLLPIFFAWLFVLFRIIHAYVLITYNNVIHRMFAYWAAYLSMLGLWLSLFFVA